MHGGRAAARLLVWLAASAVGMSIVWATLARGKAAPWESLGAPFTSGQGSFLGFALLLVVPWVGSLWGPRVLRGVGPLVGGAAWAFYCLVVDGVGV